MRLAQWKHPPCLHTGRRCLKDDREAGETGGVPSGPTGAGKRPVLMTPKANGGDWSRQVVSGEAAMLRKQVALAARHARSNWLRPVSG